MIVTPAQVGQAALQLFNLHSNYRMSNGLSTCGFNTPIGTAANKHATEMANRGRLSVVGINGSLPHQRAYNEGYYSIVIEVIGIEGPLPGIDNIDIELTRMINTIFNDNLQNWMHQQLLLYPAFQYLGIGMAMSPLDNRWYYSLDFGA